jgi:hypothetical protein
MLCWEYDILTETSPYYLLEKHNKMHAVKVVEESLERERKKIQKDRRKQRQGTQEDVCIRSGP